MRPIRDPNLAQLLMQLRFAPQRQRRKQVAAAERLYALIDKDKEYPFEFICFRITGYHPKGLHGQPPVKGDQLAEDLRIFVSKLSGQVATPVADQAQRVHSIEELANTLGVSTKTIDRWRGRGLLARKFVFDDGKKRLGFPQSTVDRFLQKNPDLTAKAKSFARLTNKEKQTILKRAAALAAKTQMSRRHIIIQIAKQTGRAHETIRYIIEDYEKTNPGKTLPGKPLGPIKPVQAAELFRLFKQGAGIKELMGRFHRSRSSIYRIINVRRAKAILVKKVEFIPSDEFLQEGAKQKILGKPIDTLKPPSSKSAEPFELAGESLLPEYLQTLKDTPVLNREREIELFRRYNYLKYLACLTRAGIKPNRVSSARLTSIEDYLNQAQAIKRMIIEANLRLVIGAASKHLTSGANLADLVSEGNYSLTRAVETFDYTKGFRFSSHASWAIAKDYARKTPDRTARAGRSKATSLAGIHHDLRTKATTDIVAVERARQDLTQVVKDNLDEREQYIVLNHFGLLGSPVKKKTKTLKQIGEDLSLTKERVRQIELVALQKLRQSLSPEQFDLLLKG
ncbi:MAG: sigma-70 family RNA polymerase sigma factor [Planctomycetota bacterium]|jgi:RNA polymerase sigma factor (sigma-70 family)